MMTTAAIRSSRLIGFNLVGL